MSQDQLPNPSTPRPATPGDVPAESAKGAVPAPAAAGRPLSRFRQSAPFLGPLLLMLAPMEPLWGAVQAVVPAPSGVRPWLFCTGWFLLAGVTVATAWRRSGQGGAATGYRVWAVAEPLLMQQGWILLFVAVPGWKEIHAFFSPPLLPSTQWGLLIACGIALFGSCLRELLHVQADGSLRPRVRIGLGELLLLVTLLSVSVAATPLVSWPNRPSPWMYAAIFGWFLFAGGLGVLVQLEELHHSRIDTPHIRACLLLCAYFALTTFVAFGAGGVLAALLLVTMAANPAAWTHYLFPLGLSGLALAVGLVMAFLHRRVRSRAGLPRAFLLVFSRTKR